jgi:hypothetical protein
MNGKWTQEEILEAMEKMKARFLQNADYLFCNPEDKDELEKIIGDRLNVRSEERIEKGRIYLVAREFIEQYRPGLIEQETEDKA